MRKEKTITLSDRGRELTFKIKEMPALQLERWLIRAGLLLAAAGFIDTAAVQNDAGAAVEAAGKAFAEQGLKALAAVEYDKAEPLLNELLGCCSHCGAGIEQKITPEIVDGIIEDVRTIFALQKEAAALNLGFFAEGKAATTPPSETPQASAKPRGAKISLTS